MIPRRYEVEFMSEAERKVGMVVEVMEEFKQDERFKSFLVGKVLMPDNSERLCDLNKSSYGNIAKNPSFGRDTKDWIGLKIKYLGKKKLPNAPVEGRLWEGVEEL